MWTIFVKSDRLRNSRVQPGTPAFQMDRKQTQDQVRRYHILKALIEGEEKLFVIPMHENVVPVNR